MFRFTIRGLLLMAGLALTVGATSCAKKAQDTSAAQPAPAAAVVSVTGVELGRSIGGDKHVTDKTDQFKPNDTIYASVMTSGASPGASLKAHWTFQDGQVVNESEQTIAPTGDAATEFHISKPDGWPAGNYKLEVFLNGTSVQSKDFQVK